MSPAQVTVAGAGVLGLCIALALAQDGCRVTVCDPVAAGGQASRVAAGMLAPAFETVLDTQGPQALSLLLAARDLWPDLAQALAIKLGRAGAVAVGADAWLDGLVHRLGALDLPALEIGPARLAALAPGLARPLRRGVFSDADWWLSATQAMAALGRRAADNGVVFNGEQVRGRGEADWLVLATGVARGLAPELAVLSPIKGQILHFDDPKPPQVSVRGEGVYASPVAGGIAVGATMEAGVDDPAVDPATGAALRVAGAGLLPRLATAPCAQVAGIRAATPDSLPLVGMSREPGILLAAGARRNGWLLAPLVAQIIAALVAGRDPGPWADALAPGRFAGAVAS